jgi:hypothetical protein
MGPLDVLPDLGRWIVLRPRLRADGRAWAVYEDSTGRRVPVPDLDREADTAVPWVEAWHPSVALMLPPQLFDWAESGTPVFVAPAPELRALPWPALVAAAFEPPRARDLRFVRLARGRGWERREPFRLPLRVCALPEVGYALAELQQTRWVQGLGEASDFGIVADESPSLAGVDAAVVPDRVADRILREAARVPLRERPRLVLVVGRLNAAELGPGLLAAPRGVSAVWLPDDRAPHFVEQLFLAVAHNRPLHNAVYEASGDDPLRRAQLISDPLSTHDLRMSDAAASIVRASGSLAVSPQPGDVEAFLTRAGDEAEVLLGAQLREAVGYAQPVRYAAARVEELRFDFSGERHGLYPLAQVERSLAHASAASETLNAVLADIASDPDAVDIVRHHQERRVDLAAVGETWLLGRGTVLRSGVEFRLLLQIGGRFPLSLFETDAAPPPLDPLLPDPPDERGHKLEVAVYGQDFTLTTPAVKDLYLPLLGGAGPVEFALRAPMSREPVQAMARIVLYHQNHVVQAFRVSARIAPEGTAAYDAEEGLRAELEFSRTARFENLDELRPRRISVGVNESGGNHRILVKGDGAAYEVLVAERALEKAAARYRQTLYAATYDAKGAPRFDHEAPVGTPPPPELADVLRTLAKDGRGLWRKLFARRGPLQERLRTLSRERDRVIQIVRLDPNYALPWTGLYDFLLPDDLSNAEVCIGVTATGEPCSHEWDDRVVCAYGFWGVRHQIEQLLVTNDDPQPTSPFAAPSARPPVLLAIGMHDQATDALREELRQQRAPDFVAELPAGADLCTQLWDDDVRPAILVVIGHLDDTHEDSPTILLDGSIVTPDHVIDATQVGSWTDPRSLVLLLACSSSATELTTLAGLPAAFTGAGSRAVVGTEAPVFSGLVARFAREVVPALWETSLGSAVTAFRRRLLASGVPLPFVFTTFGDVDVTLSH